VDVEFGGGASPPSAGRSKLNPECGEEALRNSVVNGISFAGHALTALGSVKSIDKGMRGVLGASVGVKDQTRGRLGVIEGNRLS